MRNDVAKVGSSSDLALTVVEWVSSTFPAGYGLEWTGTVLQKKEPQGSFWKSEYHPPGFFG
jgi:hypothetical protein